jgi:hypothetical protein
MKKVVAKRHVSSLAVRAFLVVALAAPQTGLLGADCAAGRTRALS